MTTHLEPELCRLKEHYPEATVSPLPDGVVLVTLGQVTVPHGWSLSAPTLAFVLPAGYPAAQPDCFYVDEVSGERFPGVASNYLCDALPGDRIQMTGPYGHQFSMPTDPANNILMIGVGTGIAPFRAFVKYIYEERKGWKGKVRLFYGARTGMESLYLNDVKRDIGQFYDQETFKAFEAVSPRPHLDMPIELDRLLIANAEEVWEMANDPKTYIYIAGLEDAEKHFNKAMSAIAGSEAKWKELREKLVEDKRLFELLY